MITKELFSRILKSLKTKPRTITNMGKTSLPQMFLQELNLHISFLSTLFHFYFGPVKHISFEVWFLNICFVLTFDSTLSLPGFNLSTGLAVAPVFTISCFWYFLGKPRNSSRTSSSLAMSKSKKSPLKQIN